MLPSHRHDVLFLFFDFSNGADTTTTTTTTTTTAYWDLSTRDIVCAALDGVFGWAVHSKGLDR